MTASPSHKPHHGHRLALVVGCALFVAAGYALVNRVVAQRTRTESRVRVGQAIGHALKAVRGSGDEADLQLCRDALDRARRHRDAHRDDFFDAEVAEIQAFLRLKRRQQEIGALLTMAQKAREAREYGVARDHFQKALDTAMAYEEAERDEVILGYIDTAEKALGSEDIRLGSQGYVHHQGQWRTPAEVAQLTAAKSSPSPAASTEKREVYLFDDFEHGQMLWPVQSWGNAAKAELVKTEGRSTELKVEYTAGDAGKAAIQRAIPAECKFGTRDLLLMDVRNAGERPFHLAIALSTEDGQGYYESRPGLVDCGLHKDLTIDLRGDQFKSAKSDWAYKSSLDEPQKMVQIGILVYSRTPGVVYFDNIRLVTKQAAPAPQKPK